MSTKIRIFYVFIFTILLLFVIMLIINNSHILTIGNNHELNENYKSIVDSNSQIYSYNTLISNINTLCREYPGKVRTEYIGKSVLSRQIPAVIIGSQKNDVKNRILIIGNMHAREIQSSQIIMKQIEYYLHNWSNIYNGQKISDFFKDSAIYYIPTDNPDGNEIVFDGIRCIQQNNSTWNVESITTKKNMLFSVVSNIENYISKSTGHPFNGKDLTSYKANANGVDLHYNFYEPGVNEQYITEYSISHPEQCSITGPAAQGYIGESGINQPETKAVENFIEKHKLFDYSITYHQRGPTIYYDYTADWKFASQSIMNTKRKVFSKIVANIAKVSDSPVDKSRNLPIGFSGWFEQKFHGLSMVIEIGYSNFQGKPEYCPLPSQQLPFIWNVQKDVPLEYLLSIEH